MTEMSFIVMNGCVSERMATATVIFSSVTGVEEEVVQWPRSRDDGDCSHPGTLQSPVLHNTCRYT